MAKALGEKYPLVYLEGTLEHLQQVLSMQPCENIFHIQVFSYVHTLLQPHQ
jgi:hypothetical protein